MSKMIIDKFFELARKLVFFQCKVGKGFGWLVGWLVGWIFMAYQSL